MNDQPSPSIMNQQPPQLMGQPPPIHLQSHMLSHSQAMNQPQPLVMMMMNQRPFSKFQNPSKFNNNFAPLKPRSSSNSSSNWKGKNANNNKRMENSNNNPGLSGVVSGGGYKPPSLNELQTQNRMKARKYYHPKKKFNNRFAPYAPRNTTSFIIRAKKSGGIASLVSPCPVTPAMLPTPIFSPSREVLGDMAKEEWGVDGYGSMNGLIRLRSPGNEANDDDEDEDDEESDVEEHVEVERRLDHDLSRFEMIYPSGGGVGGEYSYNNNNNNNVLENRVYDQDTHIAHLEEENLTLKERLFLMESELGDLRRRLQFLERHQQHGQSSSSTMVLEDVNEEVVENVSENESDGGSDIGGNTVANDGNEEAECGWKWRETVKVDEAKDEEGKLTLTRPSGFIGGGLSNGVTSDHRVVQDKMDSKEDTSNDNKCPPRRALAVVTTLLSRLNVSLFCVKVGSVKSINLYAAFFGF
ncbi:hypothetical protein OIU85_025698 [Salix viminalis]|uniref:PRLI-interacting factor A n=1 Tax=Salix viminalis TaxID=40686 RepID=A0A9Q0TLW8_SALVM|nr:hypothetical protein OIU85_025698 [Salix viminalis]